MVTLRGSVSDNVSSDTVSARRSAPMRPVAHWVRMRDGDRNRLVMVWEVPDPVPAAVTEDAARI